MNNNNLTQKTNFIAGSSKLDISHLYLTDVNIPGMSFALPEAGGKSGSRIMLPSDSISYNSLTFEFLIDEDFEVYHEFMDKINKALNIKESTFSNVEFDFFVQVNNNKGNKIFSVEFNNCRIESISDVFFNTKEDDIQVLSVDVRFDWYDIIKP